MTSLVTKYRFTRNLETYTVSNVLYNNMAVGQLYSQIQAFESENEEADIATDILEKSEPSIQSISQTGCAHYHQ
jgi:hypothetical protein